MNARYEIFQWLDMANLCPVYGVRFRKPQGSWVYVGQDGKPCVTHDEGEAEMFRDFMRLSDAAAE